MRVLTLSWEYPPLVYGGLGRHVGALTRALAAEGHTVTVATQGSGGDEVAEGVQVLRADPGDPVAPRADLLAWVATLGHGLARTALRAKGGFDVLHAHDWVVGQAAATVQDVLGLPLVVTFHATEAGRHQGWLPSPLSRSVHVTEAWLAGRAYRVVACSRAAADDVRRLFGLAADRVEVVPNGIDPAGWDGPRPATGAHGPLVVLTARLEYEKGVHTLLRAVPALRRRHPGLRVVVAGTGTYEAELRTLAATLRLGRTVRFAGRISDGELAALMRSADVAVVPSLYEPFGLVALEAAVCGAPRVVAATGGLAELVEDGVTGLVVPPGDTVALAAAVSALLADRLRAARLAAAALAGLRAYDWREIARRTVEVYAHAAAVERPAPAGPVQVPDGNLLA